MWPIFLHFFFPRGVGVDKGGGRKPVQITGARRAGRGPGARLWYYVFVFLCSKSFIHLNLTVSDQSQATLQLRVSLSD